MEDTAIILKQKFFFWSSSAESMGKKMEKDKRKKMAPLCFLKARDFSSSLNDRHKK